MTRREVSTTVRLAPSLRRAEVGGRSVSLRFMLGACFLFALSSDIWASNESQQRWRVFDQGDHALLVIADSDDGGDDLGSQYFRCRKASGTIVVEGNATESLRKAIADLIRTDQYPRARIIVPSSEETVLLQPSFSEVNGWQYSFDLAADGKAFERFRRTGALEFRVGKASDRGEFKVGLENIAKFQDICNRPSR